MGVIVDSVSSAEQVKMFNMDCHPMNNSFVIQMDRWALSGDLPRFSQAFLWHLLEVGEAWYRLTSRQASPFPV